MRHPYRSSGDEAGLSHAMQRCASGSNMRAAGHGRDGTVRTGLYRCRGQSCSSLNVAGMTPCAQVGNSAFSGDFLHSPIWP